LRKFCDSIPMQIRRKVSFQRMTVALMVFAMFAISGKAEKVDQNTAAVDKRKLSLEEVRRTAFEKNWDLLAAKSGVDLATAQLIVVKEFPNPTASWSTARIGSHDSATMMGNGLWDRNYDTIAQVSQLIEIAGKRRDRRLAGQAGALGAKARFLDARRVLDQGVTKAYVAALVADENSAILNETSGYLQHEAKIAEARFKAGDISNSDEKQIEISAEQFALQALAAVATARQARISVEVLMAVEQPKGDWVATEPLEHLVGSILNVVEAKPGGERPDVLAAEADLRAGKAQLKLQKAERVPDPTLSIGVEHNPPGGGPGIGPDANTVIAGVSFPLPLWNLNGGNIKAAQANVNQFEIALSKARAQASADIAIAQSNFEEARERWLRYRTVTGPKSAKVRETVAFAYEKGGASLVDLLNAEHTDNDVRQAATQATADTASAAADLAAARNALSESELNSTK
jgi:cobalt-zinc-cadmium efflux system outer membrane protein